MRDNLLFSTGYATLIDRSGAVPIPQQVAVLQDINVEFQAEDKALVGNQRFPVALAQGKAKVTVKAKSAAFNATSLARLLGGVATTGTVREATEAPALTSHTCTVAHAATWVDDLGVRDSNGNPMTPVASSPTLGQYSVAAGVYTFNTSELQPTAISYSYTDTSGQTVTVSQALMGGCPSFEVTVFNEYTDALGNSHRKGYRLYAVVFSKLGDAAKADDWNQSDLEGTCLARPSDGKAFAVYLA